MPIENSTMALDSGSMLAAVVFFMLIDPAVLGKGCDVKEEPTLIAKNSPRSCTRFYLIRSQKHGCSMLNNMVCTSDIGMPAE